MSFFILPLVGIVVIEFVVVVVSVVAVVESKPVTVTYMRLELRLVDGGRVCVDVWVFTVVTFPEVFAEVDVESELEPCLMEVWETGVVLPLVFVNREVDTVGVDVIVPGLYIVKGIIINNLGQFYFQLALLQKDCNIYKYL